MPRAARQAVNLTIPSELLKEARAHAINLSATLEVALDQALRDHRRARWLEQNARAIASYNDDVARHGTFGDTLRGF